MKHPLVILLIISIIGMVFVGCTKEQPVDVNQPAETMRSKTQMFKKMKIMKL